MCTSGKGNVGVCNGDSGGPLSTTICGEDVLVSLRTENHRTKGLFFFTPVFVLQLTRKKLIIMLFSQHHKPKKYKMD